MLGSPLGDVQSVFLLGAVADAVRRFAISRDALTQRAGTFGFRWSLMAVKYEWHGPSV